MEKIVYILIISVVIDYWLKRVVEIIRNVIYSFNRRNLLEKQGYTLDILGYVVDEPKTEVDRKSDLELFLFKKM